jgi:hypothetical protein
MSYVKRAVQLASAAVLIATGFAAVPSTAFGAVVCNRDGDCWHTDRTYRYPRGMITERHPDHWYFHENWTEGRDRHWRDYHEGRGYYRGGVWVTF